MAMLNNQRVYLVMMSLCTCQDICIKYHKMGNDLQAPNLDSGDHPRSTSLKPNKQLLNATIQLNPININEHIHTYSIYRPCEKKKKDL